MERPRPEQIHTTTTQIDNSQVLARIQQLRKKLEKDLQKK
jgi:hypothetical protein